MFCRKCGKEIPDDSEFCPKCGTVVGKEISELVNTQEETVVADTANTTANETTAVNETSTDAVNESPSAIIEDKPGSRKKNGVIPFVVIAIVVVVLAAIFIPIMIAKNKEAHHEFKYHLSEDDTYMIDGYLGADMNVVIPATINKKPVTAINKRAFYDNDIQSVIVAESVFEIGESAFEKCGNLKSVEILPDDDSMLINSIGANAFSGCAALENVVLPFNNYTEIGNQAFFKCTSLKSIELTGINLVGEKAFSESGLQSVNLLTGDVAPSAFANCKELKEVTLGLLVDISDEMFSGCTNLETVTWNFSPYMDNEIGSKAFYGCSSLKQFNLAGAFTATYPKGINECIAELKDMGAKDVVIGLDAFAGCENFKNPEPTTQHNEWAGTIYLGKTLRQAMTIANDWEESWFQGPCYVFYDPLGQIIGDGGIGYTEKIKTAAFGTDGRYLTSDTGKTDFIYIGMTIREFTEILKDVKVEKIYGHMFGDICYKFNLYGYSFELFSDSDSPDATITMACITT